MDGAISKHPVPSRVYATPVVKDTVMQHTFHTHTSCLHSFLSTSWAVKKAFQSLLGRLPGHHVHWSSCEPLGEQAKHFISARPAISRVRPGHSQARSSGLSSPGATGLGTPGQSSSEDVSDEESLLPSDVLSHDDDAGATSVKARTSNARVVCARA